MRPWELDRMSAWDYDMILDTQHAWLDAQKALPRDPELANKPPVPEANRKDGFGPQILD